MKAPCGTFAVYQKHRRNKEQACDLCKIANNEYSKQWRLKNPDKTLKYAKRWRENNREQYLELLKNYNKKRKPNSERVKIWQKNNPEKVKNNLRRSSNRRRAKIKNQGFEFYLEEQIFDLYGLNCHLCNLPIDFLAPRNVKKEGWQLGLHIDHVIPIANGGSDTLDNVRPSHAKCNLKKGNRA